LLRRPSVVASSEGRSRSSQTRSRVQARGFTLLEVLATLVIAALLVTMALPSFSRRMRDRHVNQAAQEISFVFRQARARALGRGAAQLVRYNATGPLAAPNLGHYDLYEAVQIVGGSSTGTLGTCGPLPVTSCLQTNWDNGSTQRRLIQEFPIVQNDKYKDLYSTMAVSGTVQNQLDVCFTPSGRTFYRLGPASTWLELTTVPTIEVVRKENSVNASLVRTILLLPNGAARLSL
jgi:prepilin-type N-terminal cleavage/methylation domain-containing protein